MTKQDALDIIIPVYNEGKNIKATLLEITNKIIGQKNIYLIYDMEEDDTLPVIKEMIRNGVGLHLVRNIYGRGFINAIKTGFACAAGERILVVMADSSDDLSNVDKMLAMFDQGYDVVCGSRYMKGGKQVGGPGVKKLLSRLAGISLHYLTGIPTHDATNSFKLYQKSFLSRIVIESAGGFELGLELVVKAFVNGYRIGEIPCTWRGIGAKKSRFKLWDWLPKYLRWYWFAIKHKYHLLSYFKL